MSNNRTTQRSRRAVIEASSSESDTSSRKTKVNPSHGKSRASPARSSLRKDTLSTSQNDQDHTLDVNSSVQRDSASLRKDRPSSNRNLFSGADASRSAPSLSGLMLSSTGAHHSQSPRTLTDDTLVSEGASAVTAINPTTLRPTPPSTVPSSNTSSQKRGSNAQNSNVSIEVPYTMIFQARGSTSDKNTTGPSSHTEPIVIEDDSDSDDIPPISKASNSRNKVQESSDSIRSRHDTP